MTFAAAKAQASEICYQNPCYLVSNAHLIGMMFRLSEFTTVSCLWVRSVRMRPRLTVQRHRISEGRPLGVLTGWFGQAPTKLPHQLEWNVRLGLCKFCQTSRSRICYQMPWILLIKFLLHRVFVTKWQNDRNLLAIRCARIWRKTMELCKYHSSNFLCAGECLDGVDCSTP